MKIKILVGTGGAWVVIETPKEDEENSGALECLRTDWEETKWEFTDMKPGVYECEYNYWSDYSIEGGYQGDSSIDNFKLIGEIKWL